MKHRGCFSTPLLLVVAVNPFIFERRATEDKEIAPSCRAGRSLASHDALGNTKGTIGKDPYYSLGDKMFLEGAAFYVLLIWHEKSLRESRRLRQVYKNVHR